MISLAGRWTRVQINALWRNGWLGSKWAVAEVTCFSDTCEWFIVLELE